LFSAPYSIHCDHDGLQIWILDHVRE
jgi:hypothetical protein